MSKSENPYEALANAVVLQAVRDYRDARKRLANGKRNDNALMMKNECERFFKSQHFNSFTDLDGKALLKRLEQEEVE